MDRWALDDIRNDVRRKADDWKVEMVKSDVSRLGSRCDDLQREVSGLQSDNWNRDNRIAQLERQVQELIAAREGGER